MKRIAIIGGGVSGLAAAVTLERLRAESAALEYVLFESAPRLGGVLVTERVDDCIVEAGPDSFLTEKSWGLDFVRSIGLGDQLIGSNDRDRKTYILVKGRLEPIPDGLMFMVPTRIAPILTSRLFSLPAKVHMALEYFQTPGPAADHDETVAEMVGRHFGPEMVDRLADPLLSGVYGGDAAQLSAAAVLPRFVEMEKRYGSLSRAMLAARTRRTQTERSGGRKLAPPPAPLFTSLKNGMQQLVDTVIPMLTPRWAHPGNPVVRVDRAGEKWMVAPRQGSPEEFDSVILAIPAYAASELLASIAAPLAAELAQIPYSSSITVNLGYDRKELAHLPPGFGFLVPRSENRRMLACTFVHVKFPHRAPRDRGIIRVFLGGSRDEAVLDLKDDEVLALVRRNLGDILRLHAEPRFARVNRWRRAMAQYASGHLARVRRIEELRQQTPGLFLAGNAYRGIGVPDCIATGQQAAKEAAAGIGAVPTETIHNRTS